MGKLNVHEIPPGKVCIYGVGSGGINALKEITEHRLDVNVVCFLDSERNGRFQGFPMMTVTELLNSGLDYDYILVASAFSFEIGVNLIKHGVMDYHRFFFTYTWKEETNMCLSPREWEQKSRRHTYVLGTDGRIRLPQLDLNLTEHCNLKCGGCNHFCPIADKWFYPLEQCEQELERLSQFVNTIDKIFIVGGEPLLHPDVAEFFKLVRTFYPDSELYIWSNGVLLKKMPESFWDSCRKYQVKLRVTNYPHLKHNAPEWSALIANKLGSFYGFDREECCLMLTDKQLSGKSMSQCALEIITLSRGAIYHCPYEAYIHFFNKAFNASFPEKQGYDIFSESASAQGLQDYLVFPSKLCFQCKNKDDIVLVDWKHGQIVPEAWVLKESRK